MKTAVRVMLVMALMAFSSAAFAQEECNLPGGCGPFSQDPGDGGSSGGGSCFACVQSASGQAACESYFWFTTTPRDIYNQPGRSFCQTYNSATAHYCGMGGSACYAPQCSNGTDCGPPSAEAFSVTPGATNPHPRAMRYYEVHFDMMTAQLEQFLVEEKLVTAWQLLDLRQRAGDVGGDAKAVYEVYRAEATLRTGLALRDGNVFVPAKRR